MYEVVYERRGSAGGAWGGKGSVLTGRGGGAFSPNCGVSYAGGARAIFLSPSPCSPSLASGGSPAHRDREADHRGSADGRRSRGGCGGGHGGCGGILGSRGKLDPAGRVGGRETGARPSCWELGHSLWHPNTRPTPSPCRASALARASSLFFHTQQDPTARTLPSRHSSALVRIPRLPRQHTHCATPISHQHTHLAEFQPEISLPFPIKRSIVRT